jgi:hypothetical protein
VSSIHTASGSSCGSAAPTKPSRSADQILLFKAVDVTRLRPATIFLGSSWAAFGLDPHHRAFAGKNAVYNLALYGGQPLLMRRYFEHALFNHPGLKTVILGADFFVLSKKVEPPDGYSESRLDRASIDWADTINTLFSIDAFVASVRTVIRGAATARPRRARYRPARVPYFPGTFRGSAMELF